MKYVPLATRVRPKHIHEIVGQKHLLSNDAIIGRMLNGDGIFSLVLCGKPGTGKTTLARIITSTKGLRFFEISAVDSGVKDVKKIISDNADVHSFVLFLDEIHRFNKSQQDLLLPYVESGQIILIGATTENPTYYLNDALVSRLAIVRLYPLNETETKELIDKAILKDEILSNKRVSLDESIYSSIYSFASGDCRKTLNLVERMIMLASSEDTVLDKTIFNMAVGDSLRDFHRDGKEFYEQLSAFHKSIRGTDPDAAIFWLALMLDNGVDPLVIARRMLCIASEDIGNADPQAILIATNAWTAFEKLGMPEGRLILSHAAIYLAVAPKSNSCYMALSNATLEIKKNKNINVPQHLKNYKDSNYLYPHDYPNNFVNQSYMPNNVQSYFYIPSDNGFESKVKKKIDSIRTIKKTFVK
jgi:putative ATPase